MNDKRNSWLTWTAVGLGSVAALFVALTLFTPSVVSLLSENEVAFELRTDRQPDAIRLPQTSGAIQILFEPDNVEVFNGAEQTDTQPGLYLIPSCAHGCSIHFAARSAQTATRVHITYLAHDSEYVGDIPASYQG